MKLLECDAHFFKKQFIPCSYGLFKLICVNLIGDS